MKKYKTACNSLRQGQLDRIMSKIKDYHPITNGKEKQIKCGLQKLNYLARLPDIKKMAKEK